MNDAPFATCVSTAYSGPGVSFCFSSEKTDKLNAFLLKKLKVATEK